MPTQKQLHRSQVSFDRIGPMNWRLTQRIEYVNEGEIVSIVVASELIRDPGHSIQELERVALIQAQKVLTELLQRPNLED